MEPSAPIDVVCLSLEPWDQVWRRNQHFAAGLLDRRSDLRLLFVETPVDVGHALRQGHRPGPTGRRPVGTTGRLWAFTPRKWLPRRIWPRADRSLGQQVLRECRRLGFRRPVLWINDSTYAELPTATGWPSVYDVTDDWVLARTNEREEDRQRRNDAELVRVATEVVVCSPALAESRGRTRSVHLITNGVDLDRLRTPAGRPADLPEGAIVLYQGTLSAGRLDIPLCRDLARALAGRATLVFVGPDSLGREVADSLVAAGAVILGPRPYTSMAGYLQHADVLVVPHQVTPFTESLDPIKAREFRAVGRPVVTTPVAGFRDLGPPVTVTGPDGFVAAVEAVLAGPPLAPGPGPLVGAPETWSDQAGRFLAVVEEAAGVGVA